MAESAQDRGITDDLFVKQGDGPAADHPVAQMRIGRLQGIVPVPLAITDQMRSRDELAADGIEQLVDMPNSTLPAELVSRT